MNLKQKYQNAEISTKITWTYTACFFLLLMIINAVMYFGVYYALYRPASRSIIQSMESVKNLMDTLAQNPHAFNPNSIGKPLVAGVILRAVDDNGNILEDTAPYYISNEDFDEYVMDNPSILANKDMEVAAIYGALIYRAKMDYTFEDEHVALYFFCTITSEKDLFDMLENMLLLLDILGLIFALAVGNFVSKKILKPIKIMTEHAQNIAFGEMSGRIEIPPTNDELTELAKTFNDMLDRIQGGIDSQQEFVLKASHELINPATAIIGSTELLKKYGFEDENIFYEMTDSIIDSAQNMGNIIQSLLFIARIDQNRQKLNKIKLNPAHLINHAVKSKQIIAPTYQIEITQNDDAEIFGDEDLILQMLEKFLDNAVKYSPNNKKIVVNSKVTGDKLYLSISDGGVGIAPENLEKVFERFFRICEVENVEGVGLGLTIARWIADKHNIKIEVESELGKGTVFTLIMPTI